MALRRIISALTLLTLMTAIPVTACAAGGSHHHQLPNGPNSVAFAFSTGGAIGISSVIEVHVDGSEHVHSGRACLPSPAPVVGHGQLVRLLKLADSLKFFSLPARIAGGQNVDLAAKMVSIHTTSGVKTVIEMPGGANARFDRIYSRLHALAPFAFECASHQERY